MADDSTKDLTNHENKQLHWGGARVLKDPRHEGFALIQATEPMVSHAEAYRRAFGKGPEFKVRSQATMLLKRHPEIAIRIKQIRKAIASKRIHEVVIESHYVLDGFREVYERCMAIEAVYGKDGKETGEYRFNANGALKALELMGKSIGLFENKVADDDLSQKDEHELRAEAERLVRELAQGTRPSCGDPARAGDEEAQPVSALPEAG